MKIYFISLSLLFSGTFAVFCMEETPRTPLYSTTAHLDTPTTCNDHIIWHNPYSEQNKPEATMQDTIDYWRENERRSDHIERSKKNNIRYKEEKEDTEKLIELNKRYNIKTLTKKELNQLLVTPKERYVSNNNKALWLIPLGNKTDCLQEFVSKTYTLSDDWCKLCFIDNNNRHFYISGENPPIKYTYAVVHISLFGKPAEEKTLK